MHYYLSLGANLGDREQNIERALELIAERIGPVLRRSSFYYSEPWGFESEHEFCNLCCAVETTLMPLEVLHSTQSIERELGRKKKTNLQQRSGLTSNSEAVYADRSIDIDIIRVFDQEQEFFIDTPELTIPHRFWTQRDFVKVPLAEILP